jgi:hypothetical protein
MRYSTVSTQVRLDSPQVHGNGLPTLSLLHLSQTVQLHFPTALVSTPSTLTIDTYPQFQISILQLQCGLQKASSTRMARIVACASLAAIGLARQQLPITRPSKRARVQFNHQAKFRARRFQILLLAVNLHLKALLLVPQYLPSRGFCCSKLGFCSESSALASCAARSLIAA